MNFKTYLHERIEAEKMINERMPLVKDIDDQVNGFILWLQGQGIDTVDNDNIEDLMDEYGLVGDFVEDYWDELIQKLKEAGIKVNIIYDN